MNLPVFCAGNDMPASSAYREREDLRVLVAGCDLDAASLAQIR